MNIEYYGKLPDSQNIYSIEEDLSPDALRIILLARMTDAALRGVELSEDETYDWIDKLAGDEILVSRDEETSEINGMIAHNKDTKRDWVSYLAVMPTERGGGIGKALIEAVRAQADGLLVAGEATPTSETYYEHLGHDVGRDGVVTA